MVFVVAVAVVTIAYVRVPTTRERRVVLGAAARGLTLMALRSGSITCWPAPTRR
jgi:hypothetical protein